MGRGRYAYQAHSQTQLVGRTSDARVPTVAHTGKDVDSDGRELAETMSNDSPDRTM